MCAVLFSRRHVFSGWICNRQARTAFRCLLPDLYVFSDTSVIKE
jgi:hypothetical protein